MRTSATLGLLTVTVLLLGGCAIKQPPTVPPTVTIDVLRQRAAQGDKDAQFELGAAYHDGSGVAKNLQTAREWFEKAAAQGEVRSLFNLGVMEYMGEEGKKDFAKARELFTKAAAKGNARSLFNLGVMEYQGEGVPQDFTKAKDYFLLSALQNFNEAQFNLAVMYAKGEGMATDIGQAYAWFTLAKENGNPRAEEVLKNIERALTPEQKTIAEQALASVRKELGVKQQQP